MDFKASDVATAVHEVGHALLSRRAGLTVVSATLFDGGPYAGLVRLAEDVVDNSVLPGYLISTMAGVEAERVFYEKIYGSVTSNEERILSQCSQTDHSNARSVLRDQCPELDGLSLGWARRQARMAVEESWPVVYRLALRLAQRRSMAGSELGA